MSKQSQNESVPILNIFCEEFLAKYRIVQDQYPPNSSDPQPLFNFFFFPNLEIYHKGKIWSRH